MNDCMTWNFNGMLQCMDTLHYNLFQYIETYLPLYYSYYMYLALPTGPSPLQKIGISHIFIFNN